MFTEMKSLDNLRVIVTDREPNLTSYFINKNVSTFSNFPEDIYQQIFTSTFV